MIQSKEAASYAPGGSLRGSTRT